MIQKTRQFARYWVLAGAAIRQAIATRCRAVAITAAPINTQYLSVTFAQLDCALPKSNGALPVIADATVNSIKAE
ncbi:MAG: hypothetical protein ACI9WS_002419 [Paraglaciecola psychrophila]